MIAGHTYLIAGGGKNTKNGAPATQAQLVGPDGLAVDSHGNIVTGGQVIAEATGTFFGQHMMAGHVYTVGGNTTAQVIDAHGNAVVTLDDRHVEIIAATSGTFYGRAMVAGHTYVVAGDGDQTSSGDGGPAVDAGMFPNSAAIDSSGNLLIGDGTVFGTLRVVAETSRTFYGQPMTAGDIYTIAGGGSGYGNGLLALDAKFDNNFSLAVGPGNVILVGESLDGVVRRLSQQP